MPFERTTCNCAACQVGCRTMPGMLGAGDLDRIADHLGADRDELMLSSFVAGTGAKVIAVPRSGSPVLVEIPTITPKQREDGSCVFLQADGLCQIHPVSPYGCRMVDAHMDRAEGDRRVKQALFEITLSNQYQEDHFFLKLLGHEAPPTVERRAAFEREYAKVQ